MPLEAGLPQPRSGLAGLQDRFLGPGATGAEIGLIWAMALAGGLAQVAYAAWLGLAWSWWQYLVAALVACDLVGGAVSNCSSVTKRWYYRPGQGFQNHLGFIALHLHPFVLAWLFPGLGWLWALAVYAYLVGGALLLLSTPLYLKRPLAAALLIGGIALGLMLLPTAPGLQWFGPVFYLKLLMGHAVPEEPFRP